MNHDSDVDIKQYISSKTVKSMLDVSYTTLHRSAKTDKVRFIKTPFGQKRYNISDIQTILNFNSTPPQKTKICYCRVSSSKQMDDLNRQQDFFREKYPDHELVTDIGSGINWKRKGLKTIWERAMLGDISEVVVAHRDRLCRFAYELLEFIFQKHQVKLVVLDKTAQQSSNTELADDILSIITVCTEKGKRRYRSEEDTNLSQSTPEEDL